MDAAAGHPIRGVIFDLHGTLMHAGEPADWLAAALDLMASESGGRAEYGGQPGAWLDVPDPDALNAWAERIWDHARQIDPDSSRDLSPAQHRAVFDALIERIEVIPAPLGDALYRTMTDRWQAFAEAPAVLAALRARGVRTAILSNVGVDPRPALARCGLAELVDADVLSLEVGMVKPDPAIFLLAASRLGLEPGELLMVGDSVEDDGGAARVGMRTLILPRTPGPSHGLEQVLRLVGST